MKYKIFKLSLALLFLILFSCQKNHEPLNSENAAQYSEITMKLLDFEASLKLKSSETIPIDEAQWYLEGLLNLQKANNSHIFRDIVFFNDTIYIEIEDGRIALDKLNEAFSILKGIITGYEDLVDDPDYKADIIDLNFDVLDNQNASISMGTSFGINLVGNYMAFGSEDYWYWGWLYGKCGSYEGLYFGERDAATELQRRFNGGYSVPYGYYVHVTTAGNIMGDDPLLGDDPQNPAYPTRKKMMFYQQEHYNYPMQCLDPDELNYYLSKFDYIADVFKPATPAGLQVGRVQVDATTIPSGQYPARLHLYTIRYGHYVPYIIYD